jgi:ubiquinone/menaquinone biosynthesis C-methylase UbiE
MPARRIRRGTQVIPRISSTEEIARIRAEYRRRGESIPGDYYSLHKPANLFLHSNIARRAIELLAREKFFPLERRRIADIGCGAGSWLFNYLAWGAHPGLLHGIDLDADRVAEAQFRLPHADLREGDAQELPWADESFDLVSQFTMFTSILSDEVKRRIAAEMLRTLKTNGRILWYDFVVNNPNNPHVRGIPLREIRSLFPQCSIVYRTLTLAPPIARCLVPKSWSLSILLELVPALRTHCICLISKNRDS